MMVMVIVVVVTEMVVMEMVVMEMVVMEMVMAMVVMAMEDAGWQQHLVPKLIQISSPLMEGRSSHIHSDRRTARGWF